MGWEPRLALEASLWAGAHQHPGWVWAEPLINRWKMGADFVLGAEEVNIPEIQFRSRGFSERSLKMRKKSMDIGEGLPLPPASPAKPSRARTRCLRPCHLARGTAVDGERSGALDE